MAKETPKKVAETVRTETNKTTEDFVEARSAGDNKGNRYVHTYTIASKPKWVESEYDHTANLVGTLTQALVSGLHPLGEARFESDEVQRDGVCVELTYSVAVKPVEDGPTSTETVAPSQSEHINK